MSTTKKTGDYFADIALIKRSKMQEGLIEPSPLALPDKVISLETLDRSAVFIAGAKVDTASKLSRALSQSRKVHQPFLKEYAPSLPVVRSRQLIKKFNWRLVPENSLAEFKRAESGKGKWESVTIPHYGGPIGRATAYYRTSFKLTAKMIQDRTVNLLFKGVDYKAQVYVNGAFVGSHEGFFSPFEFEVSSFVKVGVNWLLVKVENDAVMMGNASWGGNTDGDKVYASTGVGWDDPELGWHHCPPGMGIYNEVFVESRARLFIKDLSVRPNLNESLAEVLVEVYNADSEAQEFALSASLFGRNFKMTFFKEKDMREHFRQGDTVFRKASETGALKAGPGINFFRFPIQLEKPMVWTPETPWLYELHVVIAPGKRNASDVAKRSFGMRSFEINETEKPYGRIYLNGKEIRLRGANTMGFEQHDVMRKDWAQLTDDILLAKLANFNFLRLTQRPVQEEVYDYCDRLGLMIQTDLPLFGLVRPNQFCELVRQAEEMERLIRSHPSCVLITFINEPFGLNMGGMASRHMTRQGLERFFVAAEQAVRMQNPDRAIKPIDGDYDAPGPGIPDNHCYNGWYGNHGLDLGRMHRGYWQPVKKDWMYGCGEYGAEGLDPVGLMRRRYPKSWLPKNSEEEKKWTPHPIIKSQTGDFHYVFFDTPTNLEEWVRASHEHQAWVVRLQSEAFRRDSRLNTCAVHLFIDAFPSGWMKSIMDCERNPKQAYFAIREAFTPLMVNLRSDRWGWWSEEVVEVESWICNDTQQSLVGGTIRYQVEQDGVAIFTHQTKAETPTCTSCFQGKIRFKAPAVQERAELAVRVGLFDSAGKLIHDTSLPISIFPKAENPKSTSVQLFDNREKKGSQLLLELGGVASESGALSMLVTDLADFHRNEESILSAVERGGILVLMNLPAGSHCVGGFEIEVVDCKMGPRNFVSRKTGHRLVRDFEKNDFRFWQEKAADCALPILTTSFKSKGWSPIVTTGEPGRAGENVFAWVGKDWEKTIAVGEVTFGKGVIRVCQLQLMNRLEVNPPASIFLTRMLTEK